MNTVVVLGASYGGARTATLLAQSIPDNWRILLVDRNSHANHLYVIPRFAVLPGHEHKAFIPYNTIFGPCPSRHLVLHASVTRLTANTVTLSRSFPEWGINDQEIHFDYCVYALGSVLPAPIDLWGEWIEANVDVDVLGDSTTTTEEEKSEKKGTKKEGVEWLKRSQERIKKVNSVLVVGGGALGIQFASDIKSVYPEKRITLLHSRARLLPRFDPLVHNHIVQSLEDLGVEVRLSTRLDLASLHSHSKHDNPLRTVLTTDGEAISADLLLLCTGQTPNTWLLREFAPECIDPRSAMANVGRSLQLMPLSSTLSSTDENQGVEKLIGQNEFANQLPEASANENENENVDRKNKEKEVEKEEGSTAESPTLEQLLAALGLETSLSEHVSTPYPHIFVIGDAADAFGAIKAGHNAYYQGEVAARNILRLIARETCPPDGEWEELEEYQPQEPAIKVSVGLRQAIYQMNGLIGSKSDGTDDLDAPLIWRYFGADVDAPGGMMR